MNAMATHIIDTLLADDQSEKIEETNEHVMVKESKCVGKLVNEFDIILNFYKTSVEEPSKSETPLQPLTSRYNLRRK